jgi:hypothetical protein
MSTREREARKLAEKAGLKVLDVRLSGGNHIRMRLQRDDGETFLSFAPLSPSDHRGDKNKLAELRRFAAGKVSPKKH